MKEIKLTQGKVALVDDEDYDELSVFKWYCNLGYAVRRRRTFEEKGVPIIRMHVQIMGKIEGLDVDHINGNRSDNRRENLRHCTAAQNSANMRKYRGGSKYKGVYWHKFGRRWCAKFFAGGKAVHIGSFKTEDDAARAYNIAVKSVRGEFAVLNEIGGAT